MNPSAPKKPCIAIACGGTGGHLFPGLAVADQLRQRGCEIALLISPKDIDQQSVKNVSGMEIFTLPAVGLQNRNYFSFARSCLKSYLAARKIFRQRKPDAVLAMGGFTSAPPVLAGKKLGAITFLHESNTIPGKANRFLARRVDAAFVGFPDTAGKLRTRRAIVTGTPVRPQFRWVGAPDEPFSTGCDQFAAAREDARPATSAECRKVLGLDSNLPVILVVGGSQGAHGLNKMILLALPLLARKNWQWLHLAGARDFDIVKSAYAAQGIKALVKPFHAEMALALGASTACVSRAGASSLAEIAAMRLPSLLVPLPTAADNHQFHNAAAYEKTAAAIMLRQNISTPETTAAMLVDLVENQAMRSRIQSALKQWHAPDCAARIADHILKAIQEADGGAAFSPSPCLQGENTPSRSSRFEPLNRGAGFSPLQRAMNRSLSKLRDALVWRELKRNEFRAPLPAHGEG